MIDRMQDGFKEGESDDLSIIWQDGLPMDAMEVTENVVIRRKK